MSIFKSIKEWLYPPLYIRDTGHGMKTDNIDESYKDLLYKFDPKDVDTSNMVMTRGSKEARDRIAKRDLEFYKDKLPYIQKYLKEAGYTVTEEFKSYGNDRKGPKTMGKENYNEAGDPTKQEGFTDWNNNTSHVHITVDDLIDCEDKESDSVDPTKIEVDWSDIIKKDSSAIGMPVGFSPETSKGHKVVSSYHIKNDEPKQSAHAHGYTREHEKGKWDDNSKHQGYCTCTVNPVEIEQELKFHPWNKDENKVAYTNDEVKETCIDTEYTTGTEKLVKRLNELKEENFNLKQEVDYYKKYVNWIEKNYILILRSPGELKEAFDEMVGDKK